MGTVCRYKRYAGVAVSRIVLAMILASSLVRLPAARAQNTWLSYGPEGGTILALAISSQTPTTLYASTSDGGIFRSTDGGGRWQAINSGFAGLRIRVLAVDPQAPTVVYAVATLPDSPETQPNPVQVARQGLYKSTDGGETWHKIGLTGTSTIAIDPKTPTTIYAAVAGREIFKSTDGGGRWTAISWVGARYVTALVIDPKTPTTIYAGVANSSAEARGVLKSTDGGENWRVTGMPRPSVATLIINPQSPTTLYAGTYDAGVFKSTDGGDTWRAANAGLTITEILTLVIDPQTPTTIYAGRSRTSGPESAESRAGNGLFKSTDGGQSWRIVDTNPANGIVTALTTDPRAPTTLYVGTEVSGIFKSTDGGATWRAINNGLSKLFVRELVIDPDRPTILYAASPGAGVFKSTDGARTWRPVNAGLSTLSVWALAIDPRTPTTLYAGTVRGVFKSTDGGGKWVATNTGLTEPEMVVTVLVVDPQTPATVYAGSDRGAGAAHLGTAQRPFGVYKTTDGGGNWTASNNGLSGERIILDLAIDPRTPATIYATVKASYCCTEGGGVFKSTDGGRTWRPTGLIDDSASVLAIDPKTPTTLYVISGGAKTSRRSYGVYKSTDGGETWRATGRIATDRGPTTLAIDPQTTTTIYVGTYGDGVFKSTDGGGSWIHLNPRLIPAVDFLAIDPKTPAIIYAGRVGIHVLRQR